MFVFDDLWFKDYFVGFILWASAKIYHSSYLYNNQCNFAPLNTEKGRSINTI